MGHLGLSPAMGDPISTMYGLIEWTQIIPVWKSVKKGEFSLKEIENETQILGSVKIDQVTCSCLDSKKMYSFQSQDNQIIIMHYIILYAL